MRTFREACGDLYHRFPCLGDPGRRSSWGSKALLVLLHVVFVGVLFLMDRDLIRKTKAQPWYTATYLASVVAALFQYFFTSGSSPGYVIDAMRSESGASVNTFSGTFVNPKQSTSRNASSVSSADHSLLQRCHSRMNSSSWLELVMDLYPPGSSCRNWTCTYCNIVQPPRSKHCHDCGNCVLQFDHHCVWLGTCIGQGNHCRFWWYILEETILCIWTGTLYVSFLRSKISKTWWEDLIAIVLLAFLIICLIFLLLLLLFHSYLVLTNQTTYELVRRRRISYLRGIPERVHPFSKGICKNLYNFCCSIDNKYSLEAVPAMQELQDRARPYTCCDLVYCQCC